MKNLQPHEQRVVEEKAELDSRIGRLAHFIISPEFDVLPEGIKALLREQRNIMIKYSNVLDKRIKLFPRPKGEG